MIYYIWQIRVGASQPAMNAEALLLIADNVLKISLNVWSISGMNCWFLFSWSSRSSIMFHVEEHWRAGG